MMESKKEKGKLQQQTKLAKKPELSPPKKHFPLQRFSQTLILSLCASIELFDKPFLYYSAGQRDQGAKGREEREERF